MIKSFKEQAAQDDLEGRFTANQIPRDLLDEHADQLNDFFSTFWTRKPNVPI